MLTSTTLNSAIDAKNRRSAEICKLNDIDRFLQSVEKRAFRMAVVSVGDREEALDLVQESMIRLVRNYRNKNAQEWRYLFYRILQNQIRDWYRRQRVKNALFASPIPARDDDTHSITADDIAPADPTSPDNTLEMDHSIKVLEQALRDLPTRQRQTFCLRHWEGMSTQETAKTLKISEGSVKTHLSRAMAHLNEAISDVERLENE